jgi:hypothetical protein
MGRVGENLAVALRAEAAAAAATDAIRRGERPLDTAPKKKLDLAAVDDLLQGLQRG